MWERGGSCGFVNSSRYRLGATNDEGWYLGKCRFSGIAPEWGEFYAVVGDPNSTDGPDDWVVVQSISVPDCLHFLFYLRDSTFECLAKRCIVEPIQDNALFRKGKSIPAV